MSSEERNAYAVKFAEAICDVSTDNDFGCCLHCGHGNNQHESHIDDCIYQEALRFLGRECWVRPPEPKYRTRKVGAVYLQPAMHLVVHDCLCEVKFITASNRQSPAWFDVEVVTETGITEHFHFERWEMVYITEGADHGL